jgi:hypothetical protein
MIPIKILTGHSDGGGSTMAHIALCNMFNEAGFDCTLYGRHDWHLDKCKGLPLRDYFPHHEDILISHFISSFTNRPLSRKFILSLHEKDIFPIAKMPYRIYDKIHYIRESQKDWHGIGHFPNFICPNIHDDITVTNPPKEKIAGIIGSIDANKQTHISIQRALDDGHTKIKLYGKVTEGLEAYYINHVLPLISENPDIIDYPIFEEDKNKMYSSITDAYLSSKSEVCPFVQGECQIAGINFHGNDQTNEEYKVLSKNEILNIWINAMELRPNEIPEIKN